MLQKEIKMPLTKLKDYLNETGVKTTCLAELSAISSAHLNKSLKGTREYVGGPPTVLSKKMLGQLQDALHELSLRLRDIFIFYNTDLEIVRNNGNRYCPDCVDQIKELLPKYMKVSVFIQYALGWNLSKTRNILDIKQGYAYGNISSTDVSLINAALTSISATLDRITLTL